MFDSAQPRRNEVSPGLTRELQLKRMQMLALVLVLVLVLMFLSVSVLVLVLMPRLLSLLLLLPAPAVVSALSWLDLRTPLLEVLQPRAHEVARRKSRHLREKRKGASLRRRREQW